MGDIGTERRRVEVLPERRPVPEPAPAPADEPRPSPAPAPA